MRILTLAALAALTMMMGLGCEAEDGEEFAPVVEANLECDTPTVITLSGYDAAEMRAMREAGEEVPVLATFTIKGNLVLMHKWVNDPHQSVDADTKLFVPNEHGGFPVCPGSSVVVILDIEQALKLEVKDGEICVEVPVRPSLTDRVLVGKEGLQLLTNTDLAHDRVRITVATEDGLCEGFDESWPRQNVWAPGG